MEKKIELICEHLKGLAREKGPHARLPTVRELCTLLGTSRATLDEALFVLEQQNVIYRKQGSGIFVSPRLYRKTICILLDSSFLAGEGASPFWGLLSGQLAQEARRRSEPKNEYHSFFLVVRSTRETAELPEEVVSMSQEKRVHGLISIGVNGPGIWWIYDQGLPCVVFAAGGHCVVGLNEEVLARVAVSSLVEQGCRRIGLWSESYWDDAGNEQISRWRHGTLFREVLAQHGVAFRPALVRDYFSPTLCPPPPRALSLQEQGYLIAMDVFGDPDTPRPDGIFITNDMLTDGVLAAFQELGVRVGEDVRIATHANAGSMMSFGYIHGLTVIEYDPAEIVQALFAMLDILLAGEKLVEPSTLVPPRLRQPVQL